MQSLGEKEHMQENRKRGLWVVSIRIHPITQNPFNLSPIEIGEFSPLHKKAVKSNGFRWSKLMAYSAEESSKSGWVQIAGLFSTNSEATLNSGCKFNQNTLSTIIYSSYYTLSSAHIIRTIWRTWRTCSLELLLYIISTK